MTATDTTQQPMTDSLNLDITQLILRAPFLSDKEKYMWIKIARNLSEGQLRKLADIFLDEENKRKILEQNIKKAEKINQKYLSELKALSYKHSKEEILANPKVGAPDAQRKMLDELGNV